MEKQLNELVEKLRRAAESNLVSVVLYGSAARGEFRPEYSNLNVLCLVKALDAAALSDLSPAARWWARKGHPAPLVFTREELERSADVFAIELTDIKESHRILLGEDPFPSLSVPMDLHHLQVERELRNGLVRLREHYLGVGSDRKQLLALMTRSASSFAALFRHALLALGEQPPAQKRDAVRRLADVLHFDSAPFDTLLDLREGKRRASSVDAEALFRTYLEGITRVVGEIDQRFTRAGM